MNVFEQIWELFKRFWEWLKSLFGDKKKNPLIKITILTIFFMFFTFNNSYAQRTELQYLWVYFSQSYIDEVEYWTIDWHNSYADSLDAYKNDTLRVSIRNESGEWVSHSYIPVKLDTMEVRILLDCPFDYDVEMTFNVCAVADTSGISSDSASVKVLFMMSDINRIPDSDMDCGYIQGDKSVDGLDLIELSKHWGETGLGYRDFVDINGDGYVDGLDLIQLAKDWGRTWSP